MTKEQFEQFQAKRAAFLKDTLPIRQSMATKRIALRTLYAQPNADQAKIKALQGELIDLRGKLAKKANDSGLPAFGFGRGNRRGPGGSGMGYGPGSCWR